MSVSLCSMLPCSYGVTKGYNQSMVSFLSSHEQEEDAENPDGDGETGSREENASKREGENK